jgi:uncharacterized damage-inducible protein DinB
MTPAELEERIAVLRQGVAELSAIANEHQRALYDRPSPEAWSLMRVLAHVTEFLPFWTDQILSLAPRTQGNLPFGRMGDDPDKKYAVESHADDTLALAVERLNAAYARAEAGLRSVPADGWVKTGVHMGNHKTFSGRDILENYMTSHIGEHVEQARETAQNR